MQAHLHHAAPSSSSTACVTQPSCLPNLTMKVKNHECANVPNRFPFKAFASQAACLLSPHVRQTVQGQLADFHYSPRFILSNFSHCHPFLSVSPRLDAEVHFVNMTALTRGGLHSSFWIVDRKHIYIGSADMDWRSLSKVTANTNNRSVRRKIRTEEK